MLLMVNAKCTFRRRMNEAQRRTNEAHGAEGEYYRVKYHDKDPNDICVVVWLEVGTPCNYSNARQMERRKLE